MIKKLLLSSILGLGLVLPCAFASAEDYSFVDNTDNYSPDTFTTEGGVVSNFSVGDCDYSDEKCEIFISDGDLNILVQSSDCDYSENSVYCSLNGINIPAGTYGVSVYENYPRSSVSFSIGASSSDDNAGMIVDNTDFNNGLSSMVSNYGSILVDWLPIVILVTLGIVGLFTLFRVIFSYSRKAFKG